MEHESKGRELVVSKIIDEFNYFLRTQLTCFFIFGRLFVGQERNKKQLSFNGMRPWGRILMPLDSCWFHFIQEMKSRIDQFHRKHCDRSVCFMKETDSQRFVIVGHHDLISWCIDPVDRWKRFFNRNVSWTYRPPRINRRPMFINKRLLRLLPSIDGSNRWIER